MQVQVLSPAVLLKISRDITICRLAEMISNYEREIVMKKLKSAFIIVLVIAVLLVAYIVLNAVGIINFGGAKGAGRAEGTGFDSPEKCVEAYMEYFKNGDYNGMLSCYAIETAVDNFDMEGYVERLQCITPTLNLVLADDDFSKSMSAEQLRYRVFTSIRSASWYLANCNFLVDGLPVALESEGNAKDLIEDFLPSDIQSRLAQIEYNEILDESDEIVERCLTEQLKENAKEQSAYFGSDDYEPIAIDFSVGKDDYYLFLDMLEYDSKWYISPNSSFLSSVYGIPLTQGSVVSQADID